MAIREELTAFGEAVRAMRADASRGMQRYARTMESLFGRSFRDAPAARTTILVGTLGAVVLWCALRISGIGGFRFDQLSLVGFTVSTVVRNNFV